eukprot:TRINITY_DN636_c0_g3_i1.p1 TRINITY_DN636_c0_g3~~TRINITY_DN636_c0_g3_i1.p1  ORF type:complete len:201 (-),score=41.28 TRINITY_DN636_c0_g3_i1:25-627(-)
MSENMDPFTVSWSIPFIGKPSIKTDCPDRFIIGTEKYLNKSNELVLSIHSPFDSDLGNGLDFVVEVPVIYETWKLDLKKAMRSIQMRISNISDDILVLKSSIITHGIWRQEPAAEVGPNIPNDFGAESHGLYGSSGEISYYVKGKEDLVAYFRWNVPMFGKHEIETNAFSVETTVEGDHTEVILHFSTDELFTLQIESKM